MSVANAKVGAVMIDGHDIDALASFWSEIVGIEVAERYPNFLFCTPIPGNNVRLAFQRVPEHKTLKNRMHLDLSHEDPEAFIARVEELGGSRLQDHETSGFHWTILADPEGNEFCVTPLH